MSKDRTISIRMDITAEHLLAQLRGTPTGIFVEALAERDRQDEQWGGPAHDDAHTDHDWVRFIIYQVNHAQNISLDARYGDLPISDGTVRQRLVKIMALAIAAIESIDRRAKT